MEETITLYISNITKSINLVINCKRLITILDLKKLVAKELNTYPCLFRLTNGKNLEENIDTLLSDLEINNEDRLYFMNKLNTDRAVLEEWFRLDGHKWDDEPDWCTEEPLDDWCVTTNEEGKVISLNMSNNHVTLVPPELSQLKNLKALYLQHNNLTSVPSELSQLKNLKYLYLNNNNLSSVPSELAQLKNLKGLDLSNNNLESVPSELSQLTNLKILDLSYNNLESVPSELSQLKKLYCLDLSYNNLSSVPHELSQLKNLKYLYLGNNNLSSVPHELLQLKNLKYLYLSYNK
jgi:hypothetical protein